MLTNKISVVVVLVVVFAFFEFASLAVCGQNKYVDNHFQLHGLLTDKSSGLTFTFSGVEYMPFGSLMKETSTTADIAVEFNVRNVGKDKFEGCPDKPLVLVTNDGKQYSPSPNGKSDLIKAENYSPHSPARLIPPHHYQFLSRLDPSRQEPTATIFRIPRDSVLLKPTIKIKGSAGAGQVPLSFL
ncbi:MAG TPA: hypothetical protein V6D22_10740 [Candidatus Obscuribacterales bacterium]